MISILDWVRISGLHNLETLDENYQGPFSKRERIEMTKRLLSGVRTVVDYSDLERPIVDSINRVGRIEPWLASMPGVEPPRSKLFFQSGNRGALFVANLNGSGSEIIPVVFNVATGKVYSQFVYASHNEHDGWQLHKGPQIAHDSDYLPEMPELVLPHIAAVICHQSSIPFERRQERPGSRSGRRTAIERISFPVYHPKDDAEANVPFHWVRPHTAEYGVNGKGLLFGKHATTISVPGHWRGNPDLGFTLNPVELEGAA